MNHTDREALLLRWNFDLGNIHFCERFAHNCSTAPKFPWILSHTSDLVNPRLVHLDQMKTSYGLFILFLRISKSSKSPFLKIDLSSRVARSVGIGELDSSIAKDLIDNEDPKHTLFCCKIASAGKRHNFPRGMNSGNNFPQNTRESKFVAFRDKSA